MIRARMEELRRERARPRAADDFAMIRARMEELRRERAQLLAEARDRSVIHPRPYHCAASTRPSMRVGSTRRDLWSSAEREFDTATVRRNLTPTLSSRFSVKLGG